MKIEYDFRATRCSKVAYTCTCAGKGVQKSCHVAACNRSLSCILRSHRSTCSSFEPILPFWTRSRSIRFRTLVIQPWSRDTSIILNETVLFGENSNLTTIPGKSVRESCSRCLAMFSDVSDCEQWNDTDFNRYVRQFWKFHDFAIFYSFMLDICSRRFRKLHDSSENIKTVLEILRFYNF